jgi:F0F1-type ATP synthase membrane subunit c/vacuolar-type H+-ATPase subunit K
MENTSEIVEATRLIAKALTILSMVGAAAAEGRLVAEAFKAIGRNPKLEETLFSKVIISVALVESTAIYAFVAFFLL